MYRTIRASAHETGLAPRSVHLIVTSPPYYGLRNYHGDQMVEWPGVIYAPMPGIDPIWVRGCDPLCKHQWGAEQQKILHSPKLAGSTLDSPQSGRVETLSAGSYCQLCGGWRGGLGNENTIEEYIGHLILCLRHWWDTLRDDGICFVNLGDSYAGSGGAGGDFADDGMRAGEPKWDRAKQQEGVKAKDLHLIPQRFALAAQADGWYVRSVFPWLKRNCLPNSQRDRPTTSHEDWIMLTKSPHYFWDHDAIKFSTRLRRTADWTFESAESAIAQAREWADHAEQAFLGQSLVMDEAGTPLAMPVNPKGYKGTHYATFPERMIEPLIRAGSSGGGCCSNCGASWIYNNNGAYFEPSCGCDVDYPGFRADDFEIIYSPTGDAVDDPSLVIGRAGMARERAQNAGRRPMIRYQQYQYAMQMRQISHRSAMEAEVGKTAFEHYIRTDKVGARPLPEDVLLRWLDQGWLTPVDRPVRRPYPSVPCTVLDPFVGSGTVLRVAVANNRDAIGVDISEEYLAEHVDKRVTNVQIGLFA